MLPLWLVENVTNLIFQTSKMFERIVGVFCQVQHWSDCHFFICWFVMQIAQILKLWCAGIEPGTALLQDWGITAAPRSHNFERCTMLTTPATAQGRTPRHTTMNQWACVMRKYKLVLPKVKNGSQVFAAECRVTWASCESVFIWQFYQTLFYFCVLKELINFLFSFCDIKSGIFSNVKSDANN